MMFKSLRSLLIAGTFLLCPAAHAAGMLLIDPVGGMPMPVMPTPIVRPGIPNHPTPRPTRPLLKGGVTFGLRLKAAEVRVDINDQVAKTYITQTFVNDTDRNLAGTYLFPLPDDTTFSSFSLHIDGKAVEGKILEANEARQTYEDIVRRMIDPGLLEYADNKTVRARIYPIPAHGEKKVELEYTQLLKAENGLLKYKFPLKMESDASAADEVKVNVKLNSQQGLRTIWSPSHTIATNKTDNHSAKISYLGKDVVPDKDFILYYSVSDKDLSANVLTNKTTTEDGFYLLTLTPPMETKVAQARDIVLVADTSGSMAGERMNQNKKALRYFVNALNAADRFSIVEFNTDVEHFKDKLVPATPENKKAAMAFIDDLEARGGTNIGDALRNGVTILDQPSDRPGYLILMTDGEPTVGETTVKGLLGIVKPKRDIRLFDFGVGYDINTQLLNRLAEQHHGTAQFIEPDESLETSLASFYNKIKSPVLSNVKIAYEGIQTKDVYPRDVKDIFAGSQVMLMGRYKGSGKATVRLTGTINGVQKAYSFPLSFAESNAAHTYLPRLWAMRRIGHLTEVAQENGNTKEVVDEVIALSKKHGIISAYTSFLVTEPGTSSPRPMPASSISMRRQMQSSRGRPGMPAPAAPMVANIAAEESFAGFADDKASGGGGGGGGGFGASSRLASGKLMMKQERDTVGLEAVKKSKAISNFKDSVSFDERAGGMKNVEDKTFYLVDGFWTDSDWNNKQPLKTVTFGSKEYFELLRTAPGIGRFLSVGKKVIVVHNGQAYKVIHND